MLALFPLWRASARRVNSLASRLPGTTRLRFALLGAQRELERELKRKDKALAETAALLVLSKKLSAIYGEGADE